MLILICIMIILYTIILRKVIINKETEYLFFRDIPTEDTPAYVGKIMKGHVNGNDIISTIIDLSYKGYIKIEQEIIKGKEKKVLILQKSPSSLELQEHELFLINKIFSNNNKIIFDDYIKSKKFKKDFLTFDKMLERRIDRKTIYRNSLLKNINKIILLLVFFLFGIIILNSILLPIALIISKLFLLQIENVIIITRIISLFLFFIMVYLYINYIKRSTSEKENINLYITYVLLLLIFGFLMIFGKYKNIIDIFNVNIIWYKIILNQILAIITLLYMFNIIKHDKNTNFLYYIFIIVSIVSIIFNLNITLCINITFFATYIFFITPKHKILNDNDFIFKWKAFKNYLSDYSMLSSQEENAILIWDKYLIYAISLGINKKIIKKYGKLSKTCLINENYLKNFYIEFIE